MIVACSVLSLDFTDTKSQIEKMNESKSEWLHFDVMDGNFVPNISFGPDILKSFKKVSNQVMDVHLMIADPMEYSDVFINAGAQFLTFHYEAVCENDIIPLCDHIHELGCKVGISIKPKTDVKVLIPYLPYVDMVLVMSVEPGFGGQKFDSSALAKISWLKQYRETNDLCFLIEVDGGINNVTGKECSEAGVDVLVAGSYIFKNDIIEAVESLC